MSAKSEEEPAKVINHWTVLYRVWMRLLVHARTLTLLNFMARIPATVVSFNATINATAEGAVTLCNSIPKPHEATLLLETKTLRGHY